MRNLVAARWLSSRRQTLLSIVVAVILVFSVIALLKANSGAKQAPAGELLTGSIPRSSAVRKSPSNDSMAAFLALDSNQAAHPTHAKGGGSSRSTIAAPAAKTLMSAPSPS